MTSVSHNDDGAKGRRAGRQTPPLAVGERLPKENACRRTMLMSIGEQLRDLYADRMPEPMPERLQSLLQRLRSAPQ